jgi:K+-sensing histidine kinase KdpD
LGAADVDGTVGCGAGFVVAVAIVVVVVVGVVIAVVAAVLAVIMLEFLTIEARNSARVDGKKPL